MGDGITFGILGIHVIIVGLIVKVFLFIFLTIEGVFKLLCTLYIYFSVCQVKKWIFFVQIYLSFRLKIYVNHGQKSSDLDLFLHLILSNCSGYYYIFALSAFYSLVHPFDMLVAASYPSPVALYRLNP